MKNFGVKYLLRIEVARSALGIFLSQQKYVLDLLAKVRLLDFKLFDTPIIRITNLKNIWIRSRLIDKDIRD